MKSLIHQIMCLRLKKIISLLSTLEAADEAYSYASIPSRDSLIITFKNPKAQDELIMYDSTRDKNTSKFHYSFSGELEGKDVCFLSDEDLISKILEIINE